MLLGQRVTKAGVRSLGRGLGVKSAAPTKAEVKRLEKQLEQKRQETLQIELLQDERDAMQEFQMLSFGAQAAESERQAELTGQVMEYVPWVLGGVGLLMATGVVMTVLKKRKKKKGRRK